MIVIDNDMILSKPFEVEYNRKTGAMYANETLVPSRVIRHTYSKNFVGFKNKKEDLDSLIFLKAFWGNRVYISDIIYLHKGCQVYEDGDWSYFDNFHVTYSYLIKVRHFLNLVRNMYVEEYKYDEDTLLKNIEACGYSVVAVAYISSLIRQGVASLSGNTIKIKNGLTINLEGVTL